MGLARSKSKSGGFTVVEVLIILAIAGIILMILFLAVPTLKRSQRNFVRKHAVETLIAALDEYKAVHLKYPGDSSSNFGGNDFRCNFLADYMSATGA
jgi:type II secretory pathway pseudopilin PulG